MTLRRSARSFDSCSGINIGSAAARGKRPWTPNRAIVTARQAAYPQWEAGGNQDGSGGSPRSGGNPED